MGRAVFYKCKALGSIPSNVLGAPPNETPSIIVTTGWKKFFLVFRLTVLISNHYSLMESEEKWYRQWVPGHPMSPHIGR